MTPLPTRNPDGPKKSDTRSKSWKGESVELDAIPPYIFRQMVEDCILRHVNEEELTVLQEAESSEKEILHIWAEQVQMGAGLGGIS